MGEVTLGVLAITRKRRSDIEKRRNITSVFVQRAKKEQRNRTEYKMCYNPYLKVLGIQLTGEYESEGVDVEEIQDKPLALIRCIKDSLVYAKDAEKKEVIKQLKDKFGLYELSEVKEKKGIKISNKDYIYVADERLNLEVLDGKRDDLVVRRCADTDFTCFVKISPPKDFLEKIESVRQKKREIKAKKTAKKQQRQIEKAKQILAEAGEPQ